MFMSIVRLIATSFNGKTIISKEITNGNVIGWYEGRMEFGSRALGNRSILANPRDPQMKARVNKVIKKREGFRPFAPIVKEEVFVVVQEVFSLAVEVKNILKNKVIHLVVNLKLTFYISSRKSIPLSCG